MSEDILTLELDGIEVDTLRGFLGEVLDSTDLDDSTRHTLEAIYSQLLED